MNLQNATGQQRTSKITRKKKDKWKTIKMTGDLMKTKTQWKDNFRWWEKYKLYTLQKCPWMRVKFSDKNWDRYHQKILLCHLLIYQRPLSSKFALLLCSSGGSLSIFPLPGGIMLSFVNRGHWRYIAGQRCFPSWFQFSISQLLQYLAPP